MTEEEFRRALRSGLGRALQFAKETKPMPYRQALLDACVESHAYSPEHGTLAWFTWELIQESGEIDVYREQVRQSLTGHGDDMHADKRFALASYFARDGVQEMREAMYENFRPGPRQGDSLIYYFIHLDGLRGLLFAARQVGAAMKESPEKWDVGSSLFSAGERLGEEVTNRVLREAAEGDADIARFLAHHEDRDRRSATRPAAPSTFEELLERFAADPRGSSFLTRTWGRKATDAELQKAIEALASTDDPARQRFLLQVFGDRPYPGDPAGLFRFAESDDRRLAWAAISALEQVEHPAVREFALRLAEARTGRWYAAGLLVKNFEAGDHARILRWLESTTDEEEVHDLTLDIWKFLRAHPEPSATRAMAAYIYEYNPCSFCRERALERMIEVGYLPAKIAVECSFDANEDIRLLIGGRKRDGE